MKITKRAKKILKRFIIYDFLERNITRPMHFIGIVLRSRVSSGVLDALIIPFQI